MSSILKHSFYFTIIVINTKLIPGSNAWQVEGIISGILQQFKTRFLHTVLPGLTLEAKEQVLLTCSSFQDHAWVLLRIWQIKVGFIRCPHRLITWYGHQSHWFTLLMTCMCMWIINDRSVIIFKMGMPLKYIEWIQHFFCSCCVAPFQVSVDILWMQTCCSFNKTISH